MECYQKGILTKEQFSGLELNWGNVEATRDLAAKIARREGIGDVLAEGVMRAAQKIGGEAPNLKNRTVLRIVGRPRDNGCRDTVLKELYTKNFTATVVLEERVPAVGCDCPAMSSPPRASATARSEDHRLGRRTATTVS